MVGDLATLRADVYSAFLSRLDDEGLALPPDLSHLVRDVVAFADPLLSSRSLGIWSSATRLWNDGKD